MFEIDAALRRLVEANGSDLHLKVGAAPLMRVNGELAPIPDESALRSEDTERVVDQILPSEEHRAEFASDGEVDFAYAIVGVGRFRVNAFRQRGTVSLVMRSIPTKIKTADELGLPPVVSELAEEKRGIILLTGTTGSGKSTTLAAIIDHINRARAEHIVTIEDPIEFLHHDKSSILNQREVGSDTVSFGRALRRVLRQDPDVILIGEMRDEETVHTALSAAETGHLVLSTLHTIDAPETVNRVVDFFPPHQQQQIRSILAGVLRGVISQRLLPRLEGGRVAAVEVMVNNSRIADLIREQTPEEIPDAIAEGQFFDMQTFTQALIELVVAGEIDREVAANASTNRHDFMVSLDQALKRKAAGVETDRPVSEMAPEPPKPGDEPMPGLRIAGQDG